MGVCQIDSLGKLLHVFEQQGKLVLTTLL